MDRIYIKTHLCDVYFGVTVIMPDYESTDFGLNLRRLTALPSKLCVFLVSQPKDEWLGEPGKANRGNLDDEAGTAF